MEGFKKLSVFVCLVGILMFSGNVDAAWVEQDLPTTSNILDIWGSSETNVFAVGGGGAILRYNGETWSSMVSNTNNDLMGIWGSADANIFVVGRSGTILRFNGGNWIKMESPTADDLYGVWGRSETDVYAVGTFGTILHFDGSAWTSMNSNTSVWLYGVWTGSGSKVFAVGSNGTLLQLDGDTWSRINVSSLPSTVALWDIWGTSGNNIFTVGQGGTILRFDGTAWSALTSGTQNDLHGVWGTSEQDVFAVGTEGTILRFDGNVWNEMQSPTSVFLWGIWGTSENDVFATGNNGTSLHFTSGSGGTPPVADNQSVTTDEDTPAAVILSATDADGDALTYEVTNNPQQGTLSGTPPDLIYKPDKDFAGTDTFTFRARDGQFSDTGIISITVRPSNDPPVANAGPNQTVQEGTTVTLDGSNSYDPDESDSIVSYVWTQIGGPLVTLTNATQSRATFVTPEVGVEGASLSFQLQVADKQGTTSTDTLIVNVTRENLPPHADAGADQIVQDGATVTLNASNSTDPNNDIVSYEWTQTEGTPVALSSPEEPETTFTAPSDVGINGISLTFELTVTDIGGLQSTDTVIVNVSFVNKPPQADAGPDQTVKPGQIVTLNGLNSTDPEDEIGSYLWTQLGGLPVTLSNPRTPEATITTPDVGPSGSSLIFQLTVTDKGGLQSTEICIINVVQSDGNQPPNADAGDEQIVRSGETVTLDGSGSTDQDDGIQSYLWTQILGPSVQLSNPRGVQPAFTAPEVNPNGVSLVFCLTVTDKGGLQSMDIAVVNVTVESGNQPPIANAGKDQLDMSPGEEVTLDGSLSTDPDSTDVDKKNDIASYRWTQLEGPPVTLSGPSVIQPTFNLPTTGTGTVTFVFRLTVTDIKNLLSTDTTVVTVEFENGSDNKFPTADAGPVQIVQAGANVTLDGSNSTDPDDGIASFLWTQTEGVSVTLSSRTVARPTFAAPDVGSGGASLTFQLAVTDKAQQQSTDTTIVNIVRTGGNQPPVADAGNEQLVRPGQAVTLDGSGSADQDGGIATYEWVQLSGPSVSLSDPASVRPGFIAPSDVTSNGIALVFRLTVTDSGGLKSRDVTIVNVSPSNGNQPPTASAGLDQTASPGQTVVLNALNSSDPDGSIVSYRWTQIAGRPVALSNPTSIQSSFTAPAGIGTSLTFQLIVSDNGGLKSVDKTTVAIEENIPPEGLLTSDAGPELMTVRPGENVVLDGSNSTPRSSIISYRWEQLDGPSLTLSNPNVSQPTFTAPSAGTNGVSLKFQLTVTDVNGRQSTDMIILNVVDLNVSSSQRNDPPVAVAGPDQKVRPGQTVTLNGANSIDLDDGVASYRWEQIDGPDVVLSNSNAAQTTFASPGNANVSLMFRLTVTDQGGLRSTDTAIVNTVDLDSPSDQRNDPPLANAGSNQNVKSGQTVTLDGSQSNDPDNGIASYRWTQVDGPPVTLSDPTASQPTFSAPSAGVNGISMIFQLTVTDLSGLRSTDTTFISVTQDGGNRPPTVDGGAVVIDPEIPRPGDSVKLDASDAASDPDGDSISYQWIQAGGPPITFSDPENVETTFATPQVDVQGASLVFELVVTDPGGLRGSSVITIAVGGVREPLIADAGPNQAVWENTIVTLNGSASISSDEIFYLWEQVEGISVRLSGADKAEAKFTTPSVGTEGLSLIFRLTVTDQEGRQATDTVVVNILDTDSSNPNHPPIADAGPAQTARPGQRVLLSGVNSGDPDGVIASHSWVQKGGPTVVLSNPNTDQTAFTAPEVNDNGVALVFELTVTDSGGLKSTDTTIVNVTPAGGNQPPVSDAGPDQTVREGNTVTLDGSGSKDVDDGIVSYVWSQTAGQPVVLSDPISVKPTFTAPDNIAFNGLSLTFELTVTDKGGLKSSDKVAVNVVIDNGNQPPKADAGDDQSASPDQTVTLDGSESSDPDDGIAYYVWTQTAGPSLSLSDPTSVRPTFTVPDFLGEKIVFELTVIDKGGLQATDTTTVTITGNPGVFPTFGGCSAGSTVLATIDPGQYTGFNVDLCRQVTEAGVGEGRLYLSLEVLGVPGWDDLMWFRPSDDRVPPFLVLTKANGEFLPGAETYSFFKGLLSAAPTNLGPFFVGDIQNLQGLILIFKTWYLKDGQEFNTKNLKRIQTVMVSVESNTDPSDPRPSIGGYQARGNIVDNIVLYNINPDFVTGFDLLLSKKAIDGSGKIYVSVETRGIPEWEEAGLTWFRPSDDAALPYAVLSKVDGQFLPAAAKSYFFNGLLSASPQNIGPFFVGQPQNLRGVVLIFKSWYLREGDELNDTNLKLIQTVMVAVPSATVR